MHFDERRLGLLQIEGGITTAARPRGALQEIEVQRKLRVSRGTPTPDAIVVSSLALFHCPVPPPPVSATFRLPAMCLPETYLEVCLAVRQSRQTRFIG